MNREANCSGEVDEATSHRMRQVGTRDTEPELCVRRILTEAGYHYRVENRDLPGSPDIANRSRGWVVFVHGCFWHAHEGCECATLPERNREFWKNKFENNRARDRQVQTELTEAGFVVVVVWECELTNEAAVRRKLLSSLEENR